MADADIDAIVNKALGVASPAAPPPPVRRRRVGLLERGQQDLSLGFRSSVADAERTGANVMAGVGKVFPSANDYAKSLRAKAATTQPTIQETQGRETIPDLVLQGIGSAPVTAAKYLPASVAGKYAPFVAAAEGAVGEADKGRQGSQPVIGACGTGLRSGAWRGRRN